MAAEEERRRAEEKVYEALSKDAALTHITRIELRALVEKAVKTDVDYILALSGPYDDEAAYRLLKRALPKAGDAFIESYMDAFEAFLDSEDAIDWE